MSGRKCRRGLAVAVLVAVTASLLLAQSVAVDQEPDVPKKPGVCALYETHHHGNGGRSYQLTCAAPIPDSVMVYPKKAGSTP